MIIREEEPEQLIKGSKGKTTIEKIKRQPQPLHTRERNQWEQQKTDVFEISAATRTSTTLSKKISPRGRLLGTKTVFRDQKMGILSPIG